MNAEQPLVGEKKFITGAFLRTIPTSKVDESETKFSITNTPTTTSLTITHNGTDTSFPFFDCIYDLRSKPPDSDADAVRDWSHRVLSTHVVKHSKSAMFFLCGSYSNGGLLTLQPHGSSLLQITVDAILENDVMDESDMMKITAWQVQADITDLLNPSSGKLKFRRTKVGGSQIEGMTVHRAATTQDVLELFRKATANRYVSPHSNRCASQVVFEITYTAKGVTTNKEPSFLTFVLLVDSHMAGLSLSTGTTSAAGVESDSKAVVMNVTGMARVFQTLSQGSTTNKTVFRETVLGSALQQRLMDPDTKCAVLVGLASNASQAECCMAHLRYMRQAFQSNKALLSPYVSSSEIGADHNDEIIKSATLLHKPTSITPASPVTQPAAVSTSSTRLSLKDLAEARKMFSKGDVNKDGVVMWQEFEAVLRDYNLECLIQSDLFKQIDIDGKGSIHFGQFVENFHIIRENLDEKYGGSSIDKLSSTGEGTHLQEVTLAIQTHADQATSTIALEAVFSVLSDHNVMLTDKQKGNLAVEFTNDGGLVGGKFKVSRVIDVLRGHVELFQNDKVIRLQKLAEALRDLAERVQRNDEESEKIRTVSSEGDTVATAAVIGGLSERQKDMDLSLMNPTILSASETSQQQQQKKSNHTLTDDEFIVLWLRSLPTKSDGRYRSVDM
eukprot:PhF_6_TR12613/c0_g1_i1/m.19919